MIDRDDTYLQIICAFANALEIEIDSYTNYSQRIELIARIKDKDHEIASLLSKLGNIKDAYQFIRFDKELILKAHDIWKIESKNIGDELNNQLAIVKKKAESTGIDLSDLVKGLEVE